MRGRQKDRRTIGLERKARLADMAGTRPTASAARAFVRKAYECCDVAGYMARKYDIKGEIGIGQDGPEKV